MAILEKQLFFGGYFLLYVFRMYNESQENICVSYFRILRTSQMISHNFRVAFVCRTCNTVIDTKENYSNHNKCLLLF